MLFGNEIRAKMVKMTTWSKVLVTNFVLMSKRLNWNVGIQVQICPPEQLETEFEQLKTIGKTEVETNYQIHKNWWFIQIFNIKIGQN